MNPVIFDTGPLVAWFCLRDQHHAWARQTFAQIPAGGLISEAVLAEVSHLVAKGGVARGKVLEFVERGGLTPVSPGGELPALRDSLNRYADTPMDFADACVVRLAELNTDAAVCTTDGDFCFSARTAAN
ncbi:MAG: type II toxin-antitoxin system VapC family toxin [Verrucomicrobiota bacterium]|nr:type II toxin-antitoxin system VapC family toxin [Verrucomicrobiota bacterium]